MTPSELATALKQAGVDMDEAALDAMMSGILAGPEPMDDRWTDIFAPGLPPALRAALSSYRTEAAMARDSGLGVAPAPPERLAAVRKVMRDLSLDALLVPRTDEYQGEYVSERAERLQWLTGFSGSAGAAALRLDSAAIFVDGRYTLQVENEVDTSVFTVRHLVSQPVSRWISDCCVEGDRIGIDPWLHTQAGFRALEKEAEKIGASLVLLDQNPIDMVWADQPSAPLSPIRPHGVEFAGEESAKKRTRLADRLKSDNVDAAVITASDSIAWLLNVRGGDVPRCPLPLSFAILNADATVDWFVDPRKPVAGLGEHLGNGVTLHPVDAFVPALEALGRDGRKVLADPSSAALRIFAALKGASVVEGEDPCLRPKAVKNAVELAGTRDAHRRDGAAVTRFLAWLDREGPKGEVTEISAAAALKAFRFRDGKIRDLSFDTISGAGPDGAIVHYRVSPKTDRPLKPGELYLVDSGGQYLDGTTDITRTIAIGEPTAEMRDRFTRVLKGHIAIATARFPQGVNGGQLDAFARQFLWQVGLDFDHGTGHGVGSYLNVHEGPQRISKMSNGVALQPGMILSNEPGYYKTGAYGIRIENLVVVTEADAAPLGDKPLYGFETITFAPIDRQLVDATLMTADEIAWLDRYHAAVRERVMPQLTDGDDGPVREFLAAATAPIGS